MTCKASRLSGWKHHPLAAAVSVGQGAGRPIGQMIRQKRTPRSRVLDERRPRVRLVGRSHAMRRVEREALLAARLNANVLVTGERGVGKAVVAKFIHEHSDRSIHGFATLNCAGLPDMLVESALFGHVKGSFAGGYRDKPGLVESAAGGTIFLDEVGSLSARMQTRLLWFLETGEYQRMGGVRVQVQDRTNLSVRVIASTTVNLPERVAAGLFHEDLYRRLNACAISVPPSRERRDDIPSLVIISADSSPCGLLRSVRRA